LIQRNPPQLTHIRYNTCKENVLRLILPLCRRRPCMIPTFHV
jgi:hypothetical protein